MKLSENDIRLLLQFAYERLQQYKSEERPEINEYIEELKTRYDARFHDNIEDFDTKTYGYEDEPSAIINLTGKLLVENAE